MENQLIGALANFGPWAVLGGLAMVLLRKEIGQIILAPKADSKADQLLRDMLSQFNNNMRILEVIVDLVKDLNSMTNRIGDEAKEHRRAVEAAREHLAAMREMMNRGLK